MTSHTNPHRLRWPLWLGLYLLLFALLISILPDGGYPSDVNCWLEWAQYIQRQGLANIYAFPGNNYNPAYHYILWAYARLMGDANNIARSIHELKAATLVFDFAGAGLAVSFARNWRRKPYLPLLFLLNIAYLYNTLAWEQIDAIWTFFVLAAVVLALRPSLEGSWLMFVLALNVKLQAIIFLPVLLLLWLPEIVSAPRQAGRALLAALALQALILAPFIWGSQQNALPRIIGINLGAAGMYPYISMMAYNVWVLLMQKAAIRGTSDELLKLGLTYRHWGLLAFLAAAAAALLPLAGLALLKARRRQAWQPVDHATILLTAGLVPVVFCYFNTQMHERYWHACLVFFGAYALRFGNYGPYTAASLAYFVNLEGVGSFLNLFSEPTMQAVPYVTAILFAFVLGYCIWLLYRLVRTAPARFLPWLNQDVPTPNSVVAYSRPRP